MRDLVPFCVSLALLNVLSAALLAFRALQYPGFMKLHGAMLLSASCLVLLLLYGAIQLACLRWLQRLPAGVVRRSAALALFAAGLMCLDILVERFATLPQAWQAPLTLATMLGTFAAWGVAAHVASGSGERWPACLGVAAWSALATMTLAVFFGILLELYLATVPLESMRNWEEFRRSGWTNLGAFAIANTMDSALSHLLAAAPIALVFGALGVVGQKSLPLAFRGSPHR